MPHRLSVYWLALLIAALSFSAYAYTPKAEPVADNVWAIVGPLGQHSAENDGLHRMNMNRTFVEYEGQ